MSIPREIYTALGQGRELAARVPCSRSGWHAWVWVRPVMKSGKTYAQVQEDWTRCRLAPSYDDTISHYETRYVELSDWHLGDEWYFDLDIAIKHRPIVDKAAVVEDENALAALLSTWLSDLTQLTSPSAANYPDPPPQNSASPTQPNPLT